MDSKTNLNLLCKTVASDSDNDKLTITGLASSTDKDLDGESVSYKALVKMYETVRGLSLFLEHEHHLNSVIGTIVDAELKGTELFITAEILDNHKDFVKGLLDSNVNLGFSIGGIATFNEQDSSVMDDFNLLEVSLVSLPANWSSFGTVVEEKSVTCTCLHAGLHKLKKLGDDTIMPEETTQKVEPTAEEIIKSEAIPEEPVVAEEVEEKAAEVSEEKSEDEEIVIEAIPQDEDESEDIEEAEKAVDIDSENEQAIDEKACDPEEQKDEPSFITRDELAAILDEFIAEKEEQIKADILASIESSKGIDAPQKPNVEAEGTSEEGNKSEDEEKDLTKIDQDIDRDGDSNKSEEDEEENRGSENDKPVTAGKSEEAETEKAVTFEEAEEEPVVEEAPESKYASYTEKQQAQETKSFLDSEERDLLGRNRKYL